MEKKLPKEIEIFEELPTKIGDFSTLEITVRHKKGGMNYFSGNSYPSGNVISFKPCTVTYGPHGRSISMLLLSGDQWTEGFFIFLDKAPRLNRHYFKKVEAKVKEYAPLIAVAYAKQDIEKLRNFAAEIAASAGTPKQAEPKKKGIIENTLIKATGEMKKLRDGELTLEEMYAAIGCSIVEHVRLSDSSSLWCDEEGLLKGEPVLNTLATTMYRRSAGTNEVGIVGNAILSVKS